jgi:hypothetical protein
MGAWDVAVSVFQPVATGLFLVALGWAARERGRAHRDLPRPRDISGITRKERRNRGLILSRRARIAT